MEEIDREKIRRLKLWQQGKRAGPLKIDIELHRRCNLRCLSCSRRSDDKFNRINEFSETIEMPLRKWLSIIDDAAALGVKEWHIAGGGEPMFLPELTWPVMQRIKHHKMYGIITTNGTLWHEEQLRGLVQLGWDRIHFSIDGPNAGIHDRLRGLKGAFDRAMNSIRVLRSYRDELGKEKPMLNMNTVLSVENYKHLPEFVELSHKLGIDYMFIEPLIIYSQLGEKLKLKEKHLKEFPRHLSKAKELAQRYGIQSNFAAFDTYADDSNLDDDLIRHSSEMHRVVQRDAEQFRGQGALGWSCYDPWFHMSIKANGYVSHCDVATDSGDNIKERGLKEVWFGEYFNNLRECFMKEEVKDYCAQCNPSHTTQRRWLRKHMQSLDKKEDTAPAGVSEGCGG